MVISSFKINNINTVGKGYWKLKTSILSRDVVIDNFSSVWENLSNKKAGFNNVLAWWIFAKSELKKFFISCSKVYNNERYGLLNFLKNYLKKLLLSDILRPDKYEEVIDLK